MQDFCFDICKYISGPQCIYDSFFNVYHFLNVCIVKCAIFLEFHVLNSNIFKAREMMLILGLLKLDDRLRFVFHGGNVPAISSHLLSSRLSIDDLTLYLNA